MAALISLRRRTTGSGARIVERKVARRGRLTAGRCLALLAVTILGLASVIPSSDAQQPKTKLLLAMGVPGIIWTPVYVARDKGFFAEEGLDAENLSIAGSDAMTAVLSGDAHLAFGTGHIILARMRGEAVKAIVPIQNQFGVSMVLSKSAIEKAGIKPEMTVAEKIQRMKGLRIGITGAGSTIDLMIRALATDAGLKPDADLKLVPFGGDGVPVIAALERGAIDGFIFTPPWPATAVGRGLGEIVLSPETGEVKEIDGVSFLAFYGREEWLAAKPDEALRFTRAIGKALRYIQQNPKGTLEVLLNNVPEAQRKAVADSFDAYLKSVARTTRVSTDSMAKALWLFNQGKAPDKQAKLKPEDMIAPQFGEQVAKELGL